MYRDLVDRQQQHGEPRSMRFETVFSIRDDIAFFRRLLESFPGSAVEVTSGGSTKSLVRFEQLIDTPSRAGLQITLNYSADAGWAARHAKPPPLETRWKALQYTRSCFVHVDDGRKWAFDWPILSGGNLYGQYQDDPPWQKSWLLQIGRLLRHVSIKTKSWPALYLGFDACRWRLEGGPRRSIHGTEHDVPPDWTFPKNNRLYDGLDSIPRGDENFQSE